MAAERYCSTVDIERGVITVKDASTLAITDVEEWKMDIETRVKDARLTSEEQPWKNASIYKVPGFIRNLNAKAFTPELISFGPYHHEDSELQLMEIHKERALVQFIRRAGKPLDELIKAVDKVIYTLQDSYYRLDEKWRGDKDSFLKLMTIDGCFMFEVLHFTANTKNGYSSDDPFFSQHGIYHKMPYIRRDMLMLENQLPLLLLKTLVEFQNPPMQEGSVDSYTEKLVLKFVTGKDVIVNETNQRHHTLSLFRQSLFSPTLDTQGKRPHNPNSGTTNVLGCDERLRLLCESLFSPSPTTQSKQPVPNPSSGSPTVLRCAEQLNEAGVRFRKSPTNNLIDIRFDPNSGILRLPVLTVDDATESTFLNVVAYENLHVNVDHDVTSYVCFMDEIIDSNRDVSLLHAKGIILNSLGSNKAVADLFNRISREVTVDPESSLIEVRKRIHDYCQKKRNKWRAMLIHRYFRNPWSALSLGGALFVIVLTIVQAIFAILQYKQGENPKK